MTSTKTIHFHGADFVGELDVDELGLITELRMAADYGDQLVGVPRENTRPLRFTQWRADFEARGGQIDE